MPPLCKSKEEEGEAARARKLFHRVVVTIGAIVDLNAVKI